MTINDVPGRTAAARTTAGMDAAAAVARQSVSGIASETLSALAKNKHKALVEMSHIAALAAERLQAHPEDIQAVCAMLRAIQNAGHLEYLRGHGSESEYRVAGVKVAKRYRTPGGKWRKGSG